MVTVIVKNAHIIIEKVLVQKLQNICFINSTTQIKMLQLFKKNEYKT